MPGNEASNHRSGVPRVLRQQDGLDDPTWSAGSSATYESASASSISSAEDLAPRGPVSRVRCGHAHGPRPTWFSQATGSYAGQVACPARARPRRCAQRRPERRRRAVVAASAGTPGVSLIRWRGGSGRGRRPGPRRRGRRRPGSPRPMDRVETDGIETRGSKWSAAKPCGGVLGRIGFGARIGSIAWFPWGRPHRHAAGPTAGPRESLLHQVLAEHLPRPAIPGRGLLGVMEPDLLGRSGWFGIPICSPPGHVAPSPPASHHVT